MAAIQAELCDDDTGVIVNDQQTAMDVSRVEIDTQIATAKKYPRSIKAFKQQALEMATLDEDTAASMFYTLPRAGKKIQGPSIRMAEVVGTSYGNLRYGARIVSTDASFITAQGACHDLEKNIAITYEVRRRITNRQGQRFNDDMIQTTGNAAMSIALREAIFRVVPRSLFNSIYEASKLASIGKAKTMAEQRHGAFDWFKKAGATEAQLLAFLERQGIDDVTTDDIITLRGLVTAIKEGEITIENALRPNAERVNTAKTKEELEAALKASKKPEPKVPSEPLTMTLPDEFRVAASEVDTPKAVATLTENWIGPDSTRELTPEDVESIQNIAAERIGELKGGKS